MKKSTTTSLWLAALGIALSLPTQAQVIYGTAGSTYTEDFSSGLPATGNVDWTDNETFAGFYAYQKRYGGGSPAISKDQQWRVNAGQPFSMATC